MMTALTVMILNFWTDRFGQTVQTQIRLLLEEQSDQGFHYLVLQLHRLGYHTVVGPLSVNFRLYMLKLLGDLKFRTSKVTFL